jgi:nitrogen fixation NifU-like protein
MGKLAAFSGIWKFPARVKCAILCWHAARTALAGTTPEGTAHAGTAHAGTAPEGGVS